MNFITIVDDITNKFSIRVFRIIIAPFLGKSNAIRQLKPSSLVRDRSQVPEEHIKAIAAFAGKPLKASPKILTIEAFKHLTITYKY
jgi:hypothetical protein